MPAKLIDGKAVSEKVLQEVATDIKRSNLHLKLVFVLVGDDPASQVYVRNKERACGRVGIESVVKRLPASTSEHELLSLIASLNGDPTVTGVIVQSPLPGHIDESKIIESISPLKDVDGFHPLNMGALVAGKPGLWPSTPSGILRLLDEYGIDPAGKHAVIVGRSYIVGKPFALLLLNRNATVTVCHSRTKNLAEHTRSADILVVAVGKPKLITADMVKPGAVVIDVGINRVEGKIVGDVDFREVSEVAALITPVPGGVGPMTVAMLMKNTLIAAGLQK
ncbi:MAG: bifunctional methylenetetrahydrofolate dehydrogenase/methenyltetrahydrofolate cyclohydrolase FolD [Candidatus Micrarchaeia archaeon]